jgi:hypothetical protein
MDKYGRVKEATDENKIWRMRIACWIAEATDTYSVCNTYCYPTVTMVTRTHPTVTFLRTLPLLLRLLVAIDTGINIGDLFTYLFMVYFTT